MFCGVCTLEATMCAAEEGDLRLISRLDINGFATGALQVFHDGAFGAVCSNNFGPSDADVACRQLGFVGGAPLPLALDRRGFVDDPDMRQQLQVHSPLVCRNASQQGNGLMCGGLRITALSLSPCHPHRGTFTMT